MSPVTSLTLTPATTTPLNLYPSQQGVLYPSPQQFPSPGTYPGPTSLMLTPAAP